MRQKTQFYICGISAYKQCYKAPSHNLLSSVNRNFIPWPRKGPCKFNFTNYIAQRRDSTVVAIHPSVVDHNNGLFKGWWCCPDVMGGKLLNQPEKSAGLWIHMLCSTTVHSRMGSPSSPPLTNNLVPQLTPLPTRWQKSSHMKLHEDTMH